MALISNAPIRLRPTSERDRRKLRNALAPRARIARTFLGTSLLVSVGRPGGPTIHWLSIRPLVECSLTLSHKRLSVLTFYNRTQMI